MEQTALIVRRGAHGNAYREEYCEQIKEFFINAPQSSTGVTVQKHANYVNGKQGVQMTTGFKREEVKRICGVLPSFERFAISLGITSRTLRNWRTQHEEFEEACRLCEDVQRDFLQQGLLNGSIPPVGGIFVAKNVTSRSDNPLVDRTEQAVTNAPAGVEGDRPPLGQRTPEQLQQLRQLAEQAKAMGVKLVVAEETAAG